MSHANLALALTNLACIFPVMVAADHGDTATAWLAFFAGAASFVYHLFESHKHGMAGYGASHSTSRALLGLDRVGAGLLICRTAPRLLSRTVWPETLPVALLALIFLGLSEIPGLSKPVYLATHSGWHVAAFYGCGLVHALHYYSGV
ncbi:unnamed protein product [Effrenium voratum]|uniref:Uncharacterized protein n=1 Tax=Effrenium voratum TaxID=2562239 RepID=A0AA36N5K2_9DINO|nr:unnamed protein product [Effrenium voratum]CAJ1444989.1 unnamed protein product [Effrenium voratum]